MNAVEAGDLPADEAETAGICANVVLASAAHSANREISRVERCFTKFFLKTAEYGSILGDLP
jgi:hypothetical protein